NIARTEIEPRNADMTAFLYRLFQRDFTGRRLCVFLNHNGVRTLRHHAAGEDANGFTVSDLSPIWIACGRSANDTKRRRFLCVLSPHRVTVHRRNREGRLRKFRANVPGKHAAVSFRDSNAFAFHGLESGDDTRACLLDGDHFSNISSTRTFATRASLVAASLGSLPDLPVR